MSENETVVVDRQTLERVEYVRQQVAAGVPLWKIEEELDWLDNLN